MKRNMLITLFLILFFPLTVNGLSTSVSVDLGFGSKAESFLATSPMYYYLINGQTAYCMDQNTPNPKRLLYETIYKAGDNSFGDGLIAMMNYNLERNYNAGLYDAIRVFTTENNSKGNGGYTRGQIGSSGHVNEVIKFLEIADAAANGDTTYLPQNSGGSDIEDNFSLEVIDDSDLNKIKVKINFDSEKPTNFKMTNKCTTSNSSYSCSIVQGLDSDNVFIFSLKGKSKNGGNITVKFNFGNSSAGGQMYDKVYIYGCNGGPAECNSIYPSSAGYQRFLTVDGETIDSNENASVKDVKISVSGTCDDPNMSDEEKTKNGCCNVSDEFIENLKEGSEEEDNYIKACGPIIHLENDCGANSCSKDGELNESSYRAFNHSFIRGRSMKYLMLELGKLETKANWNDYEPYFEQSFNEYCATFITENVDIYTPGTAASISGQFFIFDSYNDSNASSNVNSYFRQPYVVDKTKRTFFFNSNAWNKDYKEKADAEQRSYEAWQSSIDNLLSANKTLIDAKNNYEKMKSHSASCYRIKNIVYNEKGDIVSSDTDWDACIADAESVYSSASSRFESAKNAEESARISYGGSVSNRTHLQELRNTCMDEIKKFQINYKKTNVPDVSFSYKQNSKKYDGVTENTIDMIEADEKNGSVKYWPNTSSGVDDGNYISGKCGGEYANMICTPIYNDPTGSGYEVNHLQGITPAMVPTRVNGYGNMVTKLGDENTMTETEKKYQLPYSKIDNCDGGGDKKNCQEYFFNNVTFNAKQGIASDGAKDPYDNYTNSVDTYEKVSKYTFYRPPINTFALMNTGEYKTLNYQSNAAMNSINGLEIGYVYNIELTSYKGQYETKFIFKDIKYQNNKLNDYFNSKLEAYLTEHNMNDVYSTCNYCNMEMAFKRNCDECDPNDPTTYDFEPQFYYRSISLSDVTPNEREGETNWTDAKGQAAEALIEQGSGLANNDTVNNNEYVALANGNDYSKDGKISTYLADSSNVGKHDIYDDSTRDYLEYEVTLTTKNLQMIKRNSSRSYFNYAKMNMCAGYPMNVKDSDEQYCFKCNSDMKECESSFVTSFFSDTTGRSKWKYYVNGKFCTGSISSCIKGLDYVMVDSSGNTVENKDGIYPDPLYPQKFLEQYKNWP